MKLLLGVVASLLISSGLFAMPLSSSLADRLQRAVSEQLPKNTRVQLDDANCRVPVPASAKFSVLSPNPPVGNVTFEARWKEKGYPRTAFGSARVKAFAPVLIARSVIRHGDTLDASNTTYEVRELTPFLSTGYFQKDAPTPAMRAHGTLRQGTVIGVNNSQPALLIQPGQAVDLVRQNGAMRITAKVKALEGGNPNNWVRVENPSSKKIFLARVVSAGEVRLK